MKSMLHEASSIFKAIEEAWNESGKPTEFTIKVLETGKKGLLWFTNRPAIISISYDQKNQQAPQAKEVSKSDRTQHQKNRNEKPREQVRDQGRTNQNQDRQRPGQQQKAGQPQQQQRQQSTQQGPQQPRQQQQNQPQQQERRQQQPKASNPVEGTSHNNWSQEYADHVTKELRDLLVILKIDVPFVTKKEGRRLHLTFEKSFLAAAEEKMLFMSLSYLLIQFIKKHYKKKFKGFSLAIRSKDSAGNDAPESTEQ